MVLVQSTVQSTKRKFRGLSCSAPALALVSPLSKSVAFSLQIIYFLLSFLFAFKNQDFHYLIEYLDLLFCLYFFGYLEKL